ncbi:MAG: hydroxyneurosporene methyltransferase [Myxococcales bacterium]|nr:hydroxyneurosporene methyltransferase [Myxococcales bacterium]
MPEKPVKEALREALGGPVPPAWAAEAAVRFRNWIGRAHDGMIPPFALPFERMLGIVDNKMLAVAVELELPDRLAGGPQIAAELAATVGGNADALHRMMRFLVSRGLFAVDEQGRYRNNPATDALRKDHPYSWRDWVLFFGSDWNWQVWNQAKHAILTGESPAEKALGHKFFHYVNRVNPAAGEAFNGAMAAGSRMQSLFLQDHYDFSKARRICDIGGGHGAVLAGIVAANPTATGTVFDLPELADGAQKTFAAHGVADRCTFQGGDFFASVPEGHDLYTLLAIIHDWGDDACTALLAAIRRALPPAGRVLVIEGVIPDDPGFSYPKVFDLLMLLLSDGGRERTTREMEALFARSGLQLQRVIKLPTLHRIFELANRS